MESYQGSEHSYAKTVISSLNDTIKIGLKGGVLTLCICVGFSVTTQAIYKHSMTKAQWRGLGNPFHY